MPPKKTELPVTHTRPCWLRNLLPGVRGRGVEQNWGQGRGVCVCASTVGLLAKYGNVELSWDQGFQKTSFQTIKLSLPR